MKNPAASARARLLQWAKAQNQTANAAFTRYALEGLMARISASSYNEKIVLKGAMLYSLWSPSENPQRETKDLDLLALGSRDGEYWGAIFREILSLQPSGDNDGLSYDLATLQVSPILIDSLEGGIRVKVRGLLDGARIPLQIDVGFGVGVEPEAYLADYPAIVRSVRPKVWAYQKDTVIAEKFHAMADRGLFNSRLKDYFDISHLVRRFRFEFATVRSALDFTFGSRGKVLPEPQSCPGLSEEFYGRADRLSQWNSFLRQHPRIPKEELSVVTQRLQVFFFPLLGGVAEQRKFWAPELQQWKSESLD